MIKTATIASTCIDSHRDASQKPNIFEVLVELKENYNILLSYLATVRLPCET